MNIGEVLSRAWQITWKHKVLWIFGILAGCSGGGGGGGGGSAGSSYQSGANDFSRSIESFFTNLPAWQVTAIIIAIVLAVLLLVVLVIFLSTIGRIGLIRGTQQAESGSLKLIFSELFSGSLPYFWRVFLLSLLVGIAVFLAVIAVLALGIVGSVATLGLGLLCLIPLLCLLVPVLWFINVIIEQANVAIVLENLGVLDGLRRGWEVVRTNLGVMIVMALILLLGVGGLGGFIIALPLFGVAIPAIIGAVSESQRTMMSGLALAGICFVGYLPILIVLSGILRTFIGTAWALTFMRLTAQPSSAALTEIEPLPETS